MSEKVKVFDLGEHTLYDDEFNHAKLKIMSPWMAMFEDEKNPDCTKLYEEIDNYPQFGKTYRVKIIVEEINNKEAKP